jgi:hypothetical protein
MSHLVSLLALQPFVLQMRTSHNTRTFLAPSSHRPMMASKQRHSASTVYHSIHQGVRHEAELSTVFFPGFRLE